MKKQIITAMNDEEIQALTGLEIKLNLYLLIPGNNHFIILCKKQPWQNNICEMNDSNNYYKI